MGSRINKHRFLTVNLDGLESDYSLQRSDDETYTSLEDLADALPDNSPRYVIMSYPVVLPDGRRSSPFVMVYYMPATSSQDKRMLYAGAVELVRSKAGVSRVYEAGDEEEIIELKESIGKK
ncbi:hypothetical protein CANCADRAFT_32406 [Tortispora caseinolytica NRRL Y-17796]|uniref:ADF-H domain-containing protein n=1 Tax=Tortispora caseinolytica NRRL Y-17796 TaxID=767744 RepID=A0A1E4TBD1_9ASCO|nr:hypothetical protein CANCADRAFT_32406 [Tortispora caseinolytica NRRL Y-17796]